MRNPIPKTILAELQRAEIPWRLETGGRHHKLIVGGRLAGILPLGGRAEGRSANLRAEMNLRTQVRRILQAVSA